MSETYRVDGHDVRMEDPTFGKQSEWKRFKVHVDDVHAGWLDRHEAAGRVEWLAASPRWDSIGERSYVEREPAVAAIVRHHLDDGGTS